MNSPFNFHTKPSRQLICQFRVTTNGRVQKAGAPTNDNHFLSVFLCDPSAAKWAVPCCFHLELSPERHLLLVAQLLVVCHDHLPAPNNDLRSWGDIFIRVIILPVPPCKQQAVWRFSTLISFLEEGNPRTPPEAPIWGRGAAPRYFKTHSAQLPQAAQRKCAS